MAVGGATEPTITTCRLLNPALFEPLLLAGATEAHQGTLLPQAQDAGVGVHILPSLRRPIRPVQDRRAFRDLTEWIRGGHWNVVHTHGSKAGILGRLAAHKAGVPVIIHNVHGWGHHEHMNPLMRRAYIFAERRAARVTDWFLVDATANRDKGLADGIGRPEQYVTVYNGIDIDRFRHVRVDRAALRASLGIPAGAPVVGTVSRLAPQKAPDDFVRLAALVHAQRPSAHFVFVGGGPLDAPIRAQIAAAGLTDCVHLLGYRHDVPEILRVFDVFALTSLWEGLPRVFAQAMCAELPLVATHVDGAGEAITEGKNGFLVPPRQPDVMAERVLRLLNDDTLRRAMGQNGAARVASQFDERAMVRHLEEIYLSCAEAKGLRPSPPAPALEPLTL